MDVAKSNERCEIHLKKEAENDGNDSMEQITPPLIVGKTIWHSLNLISSIFNFRFVHSVIPMCVVFLLAISTLILSLVLIDSTNNDVVDAVLPPEPFNLSNLAYVKDSIAAEMWTNQPLNPYLNVYFFNYTNYQEVLNGNDDHLKVTEIGPYTYLETVEKIDVVYNDVEGTISYKVS